MAGDDDEDVEPLAIDSSKGSDKSDSDPRRVEIPRAISACGRRRGFSPLPPTRKMPSRQGPP